MQPRTAVVNSNIDFSRDRRFWLLALAMVAAQLLALWTLCNFQVRKAQLREATAQVDRMAVADCLRHVPGASRLSCVARDVPRNRGPAAVAQEGVGGAPLTLSRPVPVNYVYHR